MLRRSHRRRASFLALFLWMAGALALHGAPPSAQVGTVQAEQKISETAGGFGGVLDPGGVFGWSMAALGDLDGDGIEDLAVGAAGDVWILFLNADGTIASETRISEAAGGFGGDLDPEDAFGASVAALGDLDGDGIEDLAVGAAADDDGVGFNTDQGAVWILFLNADGTVASETKISATAGGFGGVLGPSDFFGRSVAALGDLDGDGIEDLAVGAFLDDDGGSGQGAVWILFLNEDGTVASETKISETAGGLGGVLDPGDYFGTSLAALGDLDGDGIEDLAVGAHGDSDGGSLVGAVWILFLNADGTVASRVKISEAAGGFGGVLDPGDLFGISVAALGDLDGDGIEDLAVGAYLDDDGGTGQGAVWILFLNADGTVASETKISETAGGFGGVLDPSDFFGFSAAALGDLDGDGIGDLAVGAEWDDDGGTDQGAVWILFLEGCVRLDFETEDDFATTLVNGQDISTPPEFGNLVSLASSGPNARAAIFDSTSGGPNDPSQDLDLLVDSGNVLILQTNENTTQTVPGIFDRPNDDEDGGTLSFAFVSPVMLKSLDLVDIDGGADEASSVTLTDLLGRRRVYAVPPGWTGDRLAGQPGILTLDLTTLAPQPGFAATATAFEDAGFGASQVVSLDVHLGSSGALDDLVWCPPGSAASRFGPRAKRR